MTTARLNSIFKVQYFSLFAAFLALCGVAAQNPSSPIVSSEPVEIAQVEQPSQPRTELPTEAEVEPSPIPGTEILLAPQQPSTEQPLPGQTLKLGPPAVVEPMLPPVDFARLGQSGRLWSFHGRV